MSLKKNLLKNGIGTVIGKSIRIIDQLVLVPFFITSWGAEYYGEWLTLTIIPSMMALSDIGFGTSAANKFLLEYASGNKQAAANTSYNGLLIITIVVVLASLLSIVIVQGLNYFNVFEKSLIAKNDAMWTLLFLMIARILNFYNQFYESYFRAARKASLSINLQNVYSVANVLGGIGVLSLGGDVFLYALVNLLVSLVFNPLYNLKARNLLGLHKTHQGVFLKSEIQDIMKNGFGYFLSPVWQAIYFQGTTFVIRVLLGPLAVVLFNTTRTLIRTVSQVFNMITASVLPEFQFEIGRGNLNIARKIYKISFSWTILIALIGVLFLYFFGPWLYTIWTQKSLDPPKLMWNILILSIPFNGAWWISGIVFQAYNKPYYLTLAGTIVSILSIILTYFFALNFGLSGVAISSAILDILLMFYLLPLSCKLLNLPLKELFIKLSIINQKTK